MKLADFRVELVGYPTSSPTDPDERLSRIRFLRVDLTTEKCTGVIE